MVTRHFLGLLLDQEVPQLIELVRNEDVELVGLAFAVESLDENLDFTSDLSPLR